jgi:hypothetical protein
MAWHGVWDRSHRIESIDDSCGEPVWFYLCVRLILEAKERRNKGGGREKREEKCRWADSCMGMMTVAAMEKWRNGNFAMSRAWLLLPRLLTSSQQSCEMQGEPSRLASSCRCGAASAEIGNHAHSLCFRTKSHMSHANARVQDTHEKPSLAHHIPSRVRAGWRRRRDMLAHRIVQGCS